MRVDLEHAAITGNVVGEEVMRCKIEKRLAVFIRNGLCGVHRELKEAVEPHQSLSMANAIIKQAFMRG